MHSRPLDMLHDAGNEDRLAVTDGIHLALLALQVFVNEHRVLGVQLDRQAHIADKLGGIVDDLHRPPAQDIAGTHQHRVADELGHIEGFVHRGHARPGRLGNTQLAEEVLKPAPVAGQVDGIGTGAKQRHAERGTEAETG